MLPWAKLVAAALSVGAIAALGACANTSASGSTSGETEPPSDCSTETECGDAQSGCIFCAEAGPCVEELNRCHESDDCIAYGRCLKACVQGDDECAISCQDAHPEGGSAYERLLHCVVCEQCSVVCDAIGSGC